MSTTSCTGCGSTWTNSRGREGNAKVNFRCVTGQENGPLNRENRLWHTILPTPCDHVHHLWIMDAGALACAKGPSTSGKGLSNDHTVDPLEIVQRGEFDDELAPFAAHIDLDPGVQPLFQELFEVVHAWRP